MNSLVLLLALLGSVAAKDKCCAHCPLSTDKCYSLTMLDGKCGESCVDPKDFAKFQALVPSLTKVHFGSDCYAKGFANYDSTVTHVFDADSTFKIDLYDKSGPTPPSPGPPSPAPPSPAPSPASGMCCKGACKTGKKYYSIATSLFGTKHCGECCMDPKDYNTYHFFEKNLTLADNDTPCSTTFGYTKYDSTATHGFGPIKMTLDLYDLPKVEEAIVEVAAPCCVGACKMGQKYYSLATSLFGTKHCGECCMDPKDYKLYHFFEKNLTLADNESPCAITFGYTKYDSTATHGAGPVKMTLDLYDLPSTSEVVV